MSHTDIWLAADAAVTPEEREAFLARFPSLQGAHVADILDILDNHDAYLEVLEPMFEAHRDEIPEPRLLTAATLLCVGITGPENVTWEAVHDLSNRVRANWRRS